MHAFFVGLFRTRGKDVACFACNLKMCFFFLKKDTQPFFGALALSLPLASLRVLAHDVDPGSAAAQPLRQMTFKDNIFFRQKKY